MAKKKLPPLPFTTNLQLVKSIFVHRSANRNTGENYERAEFYGSAALAFAVDFNFSNRFPNKNTSKLREQIVSNNNIREYFNKNYDIEKYIVKVGEDIPKTSKVLADIPEAYI